MAFPRDDDWGDYEYERRRDQRMDDEDDAREAAASSRPTLTDCIHAAVFFGSCALILTTLYLAVT